MTHNDWQGRQHSSQNFRTLCWTAILVIASPWYASAQSLTSSVHGVVLGSGAPLRSVKVELLERRTAQAVNETLTGPDGRFRFIVLAAGAYDLKFSAEDRQTQTVSIDLSPGSTIAVSVTLAASGNEEPPPPSRVLDEDLWLGTNFTEFGREQLPNGRNIWSVLQGQEPSTVTNRLGAGGTERGVPALLSAFGASWTENQFRWNGLDVTDPYQPGLPDMNPGIDALSEFQTITASKPAGAQASGESLALASPKAGGSLHGAAQAYFSGSALQSNNMDARLRSFNFFGAEQLNSLLDGSVVRPVETPPLGGVELRAR